MFYQINEKRRWHVRWDILDQFIGSVHNKKDSNTGKNRVSCVLALYFILDIEIKHFLTSSKPVIVFSFLFLDWGFFESNLNENLKHVKFAYGTLMVNLFASFFYGKTNCRTLQGTISMFN